MARGLIAGCTDYNSLPISEIFNDMKNDIEYIHAQVALVQKHFSIANVDNYWKKTFQLISFVVI